MQGRPIGRAVHVFAPRVKVPPGEAFFELVSYTVPVGRLLVADIHQGVLSETVAVVPSFQINGLRWDAFTSEGGGRSPKRLSLSPNGPIDCTLLDRPVVRGLVVEGGRRLSWGAYTDQAELEGGIEYLWSWITGVEVSADIDPVLLLELISRR